MAQLARKRLNRSIGKRLSTLRKSRGLKASWVAEEMGISGPMISQLEAGTRRWNDERVEKYLRVIGGE